MKPSQRAFSVTTLCLGLVVAALMLPNRATANQVLEVNVVSDSLVDLRFDIIQVDMNFFRYVLLRDNVIIWTGGDVGGTFIYRDTGVQGGRRTYYEFLQQAKLNGNWVEVPGQTSGRLPATPGVLNGTVLADDVTLDPNYLAYQVQELTVPAGRKLTLPAGTSLKFETFNGSMTVSGELVCEGTKADPVKMISKITRTQWGGIAVQDQAFLDMNYTEVVDGGGKFLSDLSTLVIRDQATANIRNSTFRFNDRAIYFKTTAQTVLRNCHFEDSADAAFVIQPSARLPFMSGLTARDNALINGIDVEFGTLNENWSPSNELPLLIRGLIIPDKKTLTLPAGAQVNFLDVGSRFEVEGNLLVEGTDFEPVSFVANDPQQGWAGIEVKTTGSAEFDYTNFSLGGRWPDTDRTTIRTWGNAFLAVRDCTFTECSKSMYLQSQTRAEILRNTFTDCIDWPVYLTAELPFPLAEGNSATGSTNFDGFFLFGVGRDMAAGDVRSDMPILFNQLTIPADRTVNIGPNTTFYAERVQDGIDVKGTLNLLGDINMPVTFTTRQFRTEWAGLRFSETAEGNFQYVHLNGGGKHASTEGSALLLQNNARVTIRHGIFSNNGTEAAIKTKDNAVLRISDSRFESNPLVGLKHNSTADLDLPNCEFVSNAAGLQAFGNKVTITDGWFEDNAKGIEALQTGTGWRVQNTTFKGNTTFAIDNTAGPGIIDATGCYWGDDSGPSHTGNPGGMGDAVTDNVLYEPFIAATPSPTPTPTITPTSPFTPSPTPTISPSPTKTPTNTPITINKRPNIPLAGYMETRLSSSSTGLMWLLAVVQDPNGLPDLESIWLSYNGSYIASMQDVIPGGSWGFGPDDGIYAFTLPIEPGLPQTTIPFEINVEDQRGLRAFTWPYLVVYDPANP